MALQPTDVIAEAHRLLTAEIDLSDWHAPEVETLEQFEAAEEEERERRWRAMLDAYCATRDDRLLLLRHVCRAAEARAAEYKAEADRWTARRKRQEGLAAYCEQSAKAILQTERELRGGQQGEAYRVAFPSGLKIGLRISQAVIADVDTLPPQFIRIREERAPDKKAIADVLKRGELVPGATLVTNEAVNWGR